MNTDDLDPDNQAKLERLKALLNEAKIYYEILAHSITIQSAEEGVEKGLGDLTAMAPTFILTTENGYLAAVIRGDTRISYKKIKKHLGLKNVSLAGADIVQQITGSVVGTVALIQPGLETIMDVKLLEVEAVHGGSGIPHFTLKINPHDLAAVSRAQVFDFAEMKIGNQDGL